MPWAAGIWIVILLFRLLSNNSDGSADRATMSETIQALNRRGRVRDQNGPGARSLYGRAGVGEWWRFMIWSWFMGVVMWSLAPPYGMIASIPWVCLAFAVTVRRMHDLKLSAWLLLVPAALVAAPQGAFLLARALHLTAETSMFSLPEGWQMVAAAISFSGIILVAGLAFMPGAKISNVYGEADAY